LTRQIAHKDLDHAITQMKFSPKRQARTIVRALEHAKQEAIKLEDMEDGKIVVDQAWVGRTTPRRQFWARARGRPNVRMRPRTQFTVVLRPVSVVQERVEKVKKRKLESLGRRPSERKPIYNPRPYYTW
jgi:ribosomal protein L22